MQVECNSNHSIPARGHRHFGSSIQVTPSKHLEGFGNRWHLVCSFPMHIKLIDVNSVWTYSRIALAYLAAGNPKQDIEGSSRIARVGRGNCSAPSSVRAGQIPFSW